MHIFENTIERLAWMTQQQLIGLGFPLAEPWPECRLDADAPLDGRSLDLGRDAHTLRSCLILATALLRAERGKKFLVLVEHSVREALGDRQLWNAVTVFPVGGELIRYQPVLVEARFARNQAACKDGVLCEVDAAHLSAWSGKPVGQNGPAAPPRFTH